MDGNERERTGMHGKGVTRMVHDTRISRDVVGSCMSPTRTPDNPHKCLIPNFPETPHFCPRKIFEIWAFLTEMAPDLPAGSPNLTEHGSNL